ncbi:MAG: Adenylate cyclase [Parcubacteria group bacterium GW2011_GWF2_39_13b]|nr:MAG: Adenylate cyclase [Parcubacteria group bacterium GW2011_GWF2_39_13b]
MFHEHMSKILFVEDEPTLQKTLGDVLAKEGYDIKTASDGEEGLALAKKFKPDLMLLDLILPKKDGFTVLKEIKADEELKYIPVIVLTNLEGTSDVEKVLELGATTYLVKANYDLGEVVERVKQALKK